MDPTHSYYHIYNHANGDDLLFTIHDNYEYFLKLINRFITPHLNLYAYCLMPNHFHLLVSFSSETEKKSFHQLSKLFNSYTRSFNNFNNRKGSLFQKNFKRKQLFTLADIRKNVMYIHRNPLHHGFSGNYPTWEYSSYNYMLHPDRPQKAKIYHLEVIHFFGGNDEFIRQHEEYKQWVKVGNPEYD